MHKRPQVKYTQERKEKIIKLVTEDHLSIKEAARVSSISSSTLYKWLKQQKQGQSAQIEYEKQRRSILDWAAIGISALAVIASSFSAHYTYEANKLELQKDTPLLYIQNTTPKELRSDLYNSLEIFQIINQGSPVEIINYEFYSYSYLLYEGIPYYFDIPDYFHSFENSGSYINIIGTFYGQRGLYLRNIDIMMNELCEISGMQFINTTGDDTINPPTCYLYLKYQDIHENVYEKVYLFKNEGSYGFVTSPGLECSRGINTENIPSIKSSITSEKNYIGSYDINMFTSIYDIIYRYLEKTSIK